jgi:hypothetical protein
MRGVQAVGGMMSDIRTLGAVKIFRNDLITLLKSSAIEGIGDNVFKSRTDPFWPEESGAVLVYTPQTSFEDKRTSPRFYFAESQVVIDVYGNDSNGDLDDWLDEKSREIVEALQPVEKRQGPFNGTVKLFTLKSWSNNLSSKGEQERGCQRIIFNAEWTCCVTTGGPADEFLKAKTTLDTGENGMTSETEMRS